MTQLFIFEDDKKAADLIPDKQYNISEVSIKYSRAYSSQERTPIITIKDAYDLMKSAWDMDTIDYQETFKMACLDKRNALIGMYTAGIGGSAAVYVDKRMCLIAALKSNAESVIVAHNHPSGDVNPSKSDVAMTVQFINACNAVGIDMYDHLIISRDDCYSFAENGLIEMQNNAYERNQQFTNKQTFGV